MLIGPATCLLIYAEIEDMRHANTIFYSEQGVENKSLAFFNSLCYSIASSMLTASDQISQHKNESEPIQLCS